MAAALRRNFCREWMEFFKKTLTVVLYLNFEGRIVAIEVSHWPIKGDINGIQVKTNIFH